MKKLIFTLLLASACRLSASADPFFSRLPAPLAKGDWALEAGVREFTRDLWLDDQGRVSTQGGYAVLTDADGVSKSVKGFEFDFKLLWALSAHDLLEVALPYFNQEFSRITAFQYQPNNLDDGSVRRADASGDLMLGYRRLLAGAASGAYQAGLGLELSAPTGQGPFASAHPLVATGNGGFVAAASLLLEGGTAFWRGWLQARLPYEFGASADIAPGTFVSYPKERPTRTLPGGRAWVSRAPSVDLNAGIGWDWYDSPAARHRLACELQMSRRGSMLIDGAEVPDSSSVILNVVPEARFGFGKKLALNFGWISPFSQATNQAEATWGEFLIRVDTTL